MKHQKIFAVTVGAFLLLSCMLQGCAEQEQQPESSAEISTAERAAETALPPADVQDDAADSSSALHFSAESGFYDAPFQLTVTAEGGAKIFYTLDGSTPTADSTEYTGPIEIADCSSEPNRLSMRTDIVPENAGLPATAPEEPVDKAVLIRAVSVDASGAVSPVETRTYFIGFGEKASYYQKLRVISLVTDEENLFDPERGIYVRGAVYDKWKSSDEYDPDMPEWRTPGNYTQTGKEWERPAYMQIFADGRLEAGQYVGIRIHGGATRSYPQKSFNVYARKDYGASKLRCDLFSGSAVSAADGTPITEFDSFMLRNGGNDAQYTRFRDKLNQSLVSDRDFLVQAMAPCIVFLNGEYWGHYEITEKLDDAFIKAHYGIPKKDVCIIKKEALDEGSEECFAEWEQLRKWIQETDFSDSAAYEELCARIDMQGFMDYISAETYINNANWGKSNMAMWKAAVTDAQNPCADGRWRFIMFDTDYSTGIYGEALPSDKNISALLEDDCFLSDLLRAALKNEGFRTQFRDTFTEIAEQNFDAARVEQEIERLSAEYHDLVTDTYNRFWGAWIGGAMAEGNYAAEVKSVQRFYQKRGEYIKADLEQVLGAY